MNIRKFVGAVCMLGLAGCASMPVSDRVEYGGTLRPVELQGPTSSCDDWEYDVYHIPQWTSRFVAFLQMDSNDYARNGRQFPITLSYSVLTDGTAANIKLVDPMWYTDHAAYRELPKTTADALTRSRFRFEGEGDPLPATDCRYSFAFSLTPYRAGDD
ncbi:hypothetical protein [Oceanicaulis sp. MMSF_3324]|uniref:hypothetical protein n=1 Tax=Oceanicaulis sp. MMSF_3324 TaxID=3046702 RepID=UPI00273F38C5|nr:hypothetical protein [Oceanicaulis sp. MMSF_3324]